MTADWDKKLKCLRVTVPNYKWLFGQEEEEEQDQTYEGKEEKKRPLLSESVCVQLTLNNQEWISAPNFHYHDADIQRISYVKEPIELSAEEKEALWQSETPEE